MLTIIAAVAENNIIGKKGVNELLWQIKADLIRFQTITKGKPLIMGKETYFSILRQVGKPLLGRHHFVLSRSETFFIEQAHQKQVTKCGSLEEAIAGAKELSDEYFVIGGASVFKQAILLADRMEITEIHNEYKGDAMFPRIDYGVWTQLTRIPNTDPDTGLKFDYVTYIKHEPKQ